MATRKSPSLSSPPARTRKTAAPRRRKGDLRLLDIAQDLRLGSISVLVSIRMDEYLKFVQRAYDERGSLEGQRDVLTTTSASRIRDRMAGDLKAGAVLPPVVVGLRVTPKTMTQALTFDAATFSQLLARTTSDRISVIDGMQRTTVFFAHRKELKERMIRAEFWLSDRTTSLTYRMLVLNTGQVPWNLRRQIEVVNASVISEITESISELGVSAEIYRIDDKKRRFNAGEFQAHDVMEMYVAFGLRKAHVDKDNVLADQFSRLDMVDAVADPEYLSKFVAVFSIMIEFDHALSRLPPADEAKKRPTSDAKSRQRFDGGRSLFDSQPACVGFMAAAAQRIFGRPGTDRSPQQQMLSLENATKRCGIVIEQINDMKLADLRNFVDLRTLNEVLAAAQNAGRIGDFERTFFTDAFRLFLEEEVDSMTPCWRA